MATAVPLDVQELERLVRERQLSSPALLELVRSVAAAAAVAAPRALVPIAQLSPILRAALLVHFKFQDKGPQARPARGASPVGPSGPTAQQLAEWVELMAHGYTAVTLAIALAATVPTPGLPSHLNATLEDLVATRVRFTRAQLALQTLAQAAAGPTDPAP